MRDDWEQVLKAEWGIDAQLTQLDGEYDLNFRAVAARGTYILKVMRPGCDASFIDMQVGALNHALAAAPDLPLPRPIAARSGAQVVTATDADGQPRLVWLQEALPGLCYAEFRPHSPALIEDLGVRVGALAAALEGFAHPDLDRDFKWNLMQGGWISDRLETVSDPARQSLLRGIAAQFDGLTPVLGALPVQAIHNDVNDYNILVSLDGPRAAVSGLIDLGDMCAAPRICDLAIVAAYVVLDHPAPEAALEALVRGYHRANPLTGPELDLLLPLLRMRLAVSVVNSTLMAQDNPDDPYVTISQAPAWRFLEGPQPGGDLLAYRLRAVCGLPISDAAARVMTWLEGARDSFAPVMEGDLNAAPMGALSIEASATPRDPFHLDQPEAALIGSDRFGPDDLWLGYYGEPRLIYTAPAFRKGPWKASNWRTVHLGVDVFAPAGRAVFTPLAATVVFTEKRDTPLDYGGMVILAHVTPEGDAFHTLYGHLDPASFAHLRKGQTLKAGEAFAALGDETCNGGWAPHLHFQLALTLAGMGNDWPGVADPDEADLWRAICPNPAALMNLPDAKVAYTAPDKAAVLKMRRDHFGENLKLSYSDPVMLLRGWRHHMFDDWGRPYLDAYNNVPHVGHAHPRIQAVVADQLLRMNSNTRYLHPAQAEFAEKLLSKMPPHLSVCYFVNSGSEANELALRLARGATGGRGIVTPNHGYHGNTTGAIDISAYKFNAKGGIGRPDHVALVDLPDDYRGPHRRDNPQAGGLYAAQVQVAISALRKRGHTLAGFIAETFPSVGGQIIPPPGYLSEVYKRIRAAGGVCIADEVQTGLGRLGQHYFAFQALGASPDMVVLGKPIGNGHPLGVVVTTPQIAEAFAKGPEFFSTFGGSTLSCRVGKTVLDIVDDEGLAQNAAAMGARLMTGLKALMARHEAIGDVRGMGLFVGVELVNNRRARSPATAIAAYVMNRMRESRILMGREGPDDNILKIRPPLTIDAEGIDMILHHLDIVLGETGAQAPQR
ncbi:aminotransferase class III-fold pyridoxal phosphate-dependent enzyme [Roseovarius sp. M141]|uniref:aminotransferase class III-fold pyridoxal phosphate-dependent enzyme n=1 Tax=Roseovarius sp. M141 TaxID=2583806 RepID=UPI0020CCB8F9|nr:aminotransferase class III-fold pyridoxal phosphate-dependent enzyme [Roseovarius sp. M141]MCQ0090977.1 aminotransferase class III-fold pyridoxal phosphate-dependent enzyme [Roseovarius sp. M141]